MDQGLLWLLITSGVHKFECVDNSPEAVPGSDSTNYNSAHITYTIASCNQGLDCPPYVLQQLIQKFRL